MGGARDKQVENIQMSINDFHQAQVSKTRTQKMIKRNQ